MEAVTQVFRNTGLSDKEVVVYLYLVTESPKKAREISRAVKIDRVQLYQTLKNLQKRGMVESTFEYPASFMAVPLEKVLDFQIKAKRDEAKTLEANKGNLVSQLNLHKHENDEVGCEKFMVIEGSYINSKIAQMVQEAKEEIATVTSGYGVIQAYRSGLLDYGFDHPRKEEVNFRFLTSLSTISNHLEVTRELLQKAVKNSLCFESRISDFGAGYFPRFIIKDGNEPAHLP